ncbi:hypothetical protein [Izhakiella capsodis]|nr:hypothetical protein [Izhakiella capsodis]
MDRRLVAGLPEEDAVVRMVATIAEIVALTSWQTVSNAEAA